MNRVVLLVLALAFPFATGYAASLFYPGGLAMAQAVDERSSANALSLILLAVVMIVGIFSSFLFAKASRARDDGVPASVHLREIFSDLEFIAALFVSPLIFNSIYALTKQNPESVADYLLAYQNGFFWHTVLAGVAGKPANKPAKAKGNRAAGPPQS